MPVCEESPRPVSPRRASSRPLSLPALVRMHVCKRVVTGCPARPTNEVLYSLAIIKFGFFRVVGVGIGPTRFERGVVEISDYFFVLHLPPTFKHSSLLWRPARVSDLVIVRFLVSDDAGFTVPASLSPYVSTVCLLTVRIRFSDF